MKKSRKKRTKTIVNKTKGQKYIFYNKKQSGMRCIINEKKYVSNEVILDTNYSENEIFITHRNGDYIQGVDFTIDEFFKKFRACSNRKLLWLGKINKELIDKVKRDTNFDLTGKSLVISSDNSAHLNKHNEQNYKTYANPVPINIDTLNNLANILNMYETVVYYKEGNQDRLKFEIDTGFNYYYRVIEMIPIRNKTSVLVSIYTIKKGRPSRTKCNNASSFITSTNKGNDLNYAPKNNISNSSKKVNRK